MTDILSQLPPASFRGIKFPLLERPQAHHAHRRAKKDLQYSGGQPIDMTGSDCWVYRYLVPLHQGVTSSGWRDLFAVTYPKLLAAYLDKSRGELVDPFHGSKQVRPGSWDEVVSKKARGGLNVELLFEEDWEIGEEQPTEIVTLAGAEAEAKRLDDEVEAIAQEEQWEPPESTANPLGQIAGLGQQLQRNRDVITSKFDGCSHRCEQIERQLDELEDPKRTEEPIRSARNLRVTTFRLARRTKDPAKVIKQHTVAARTFLSSLARELRMTPEELLELNPELAGYTIIPQGLTIKYKAKPRGG